MKITPSSSKYKNHKNSIARCYKCKKHLFEKPYQLKVCRICYIADRDKSVSAKDSSNIIDYYA